MTASAFEEIVGPLRLQRGVDALGHLRAFLWEREWVAAVGAWRCLAAVWPLLSPEQRDELKLLALDVFDTPGRIPYAEAKREAVRRL